MSWMQKIRIVWRLGRYAYEWYLLAAADRRVTMPEVAGLFAGLAEFVPWGDELKISVPNHPDEIVHEIRRVQLLTHRRTGLGVTVQDV